MRLLTGRPAPRAAAPAARARTEPRFDDGGSATLQPQQAPEDEEYEEEDAEEEEAEAPRLQRKPKTAPRGKKSAGGYVLPPLELLAAPKNIGRTVLSADALQANATALEGVLGDFAACAARSSMRGRARWSRSTSSSPRPASSRRG